MIDADDWFKDLPDPCIIFDGGSDGMPFELFDIPKGGGGGGIPGIPGGGGGGGIPGTPGRGGGGFPFPKINKNNH